MGRFESFPRRVLDFWRSRVRIPGEETDEKVVARFDPQMEELPDLSRARGRADREFGRLGQSGPAPGRADAGGGRGRRSGWLYGLALDLRFATRSLRREWTATLAAIATLGLGIGAVTSVFGLVNWVALRPVPGVAEPDRLVRVQMWEIGGEQVAGLSYANLVDLREGAPALQALAGYAPIGLQAAVQGAPPVALMGETVAGDYFGVLGLRPASGRLLSPEESGSADPHYQAVISHRLWRTHLGSDPAVAGRRLRLNGADFSVVGVAPEGFRGTERLGETDVWVPFSTYGILQHQDDWSLADRRQGILRELVGRLRPGAEPGLAQEQLRAGMARLVEAYPEENRIHSAYVPTVFPGIGMDVRARDPVARTLSLMSGIAAIVLLVAWANAGNLLLLRGVRRRGETAVRRALGASTARLLRAHFVEAALLALLGGGLGMLLALGATRLLRGRLFGWLPEIEQVGVDGRVLAFALFLTLCSGALFGVIPWFAMRAEGLLRHLKEASRTSTGRTGWLRGGLVVAQVSSSTVLLVAALLLTGTLHALSRVEIGFDPDGVMTYVMDPAGLGYTPERHQAFRDQLQARLATAPGVESISLTSGTPFGSAYMRLRLRRFDASEAAPVEAWAFSVSPEYFATLRIPLLAGRGFTASSAGDEVVVSRALARTLFGSANPLGQAILGPNPGGTTASYTVVGIADDTRVQDLRASEPDRVIYRPMRGLEPWQTTTTVLVRSPLAPREAEAVIRDVVATLEPSLALWHTEAMPRSVANTIREEQLLARMAMLLAGLAALLAVVGLYAVVAYSVTQRTREIGVRMALGARFGAIVRLVARDAASLVAGGIVLGIVVAIGGSGVLENRLFGVERLDPRVYGAATGLFIAAAAIALWGPLCAAWGVDPTEALRRE